MGCTWRQKKKGCSLVQSQLRLRGHGGTPREPPKYQNDEQVTAVAWASQLAVLNLSFWNLRSELQRVMLNKLASEKTVGEFEKGISR